MHSLASFDVIAMPFIDAVLTFKESKLEMIDMHAREYASDIFQQRRDVRCMPMQDSDPNIDYVEGDKLFPLSALLLYPPRVFALQTFFPDCTETGSM